MNKKFFLILIISIISILIILNNSYFKKEIQLNNSGNTYEEQLNNIHSTYPPEYYEFVNESGFSKQKFIGYEENPKLWQFSLECKNKKDEENLICYSEVIFKENVIEFNMSHFPPKGTPYSDEYEIRFELDGNEFTNFFVESMDRAGKYATCTFKDVALKEPINEEEYSVDPNFGDPFEYGRVNCYEEGKRYQNLVTPLENLTKNTEDKINEFISLSEEFKNSYSQE